MLAGLLLPAAGCSTTEGDARREVMRRAEQVAHEAEPWATDSHNLDGWVSNRSLIDRLVAETGGREIASAVHNTDAYGTGVLATVDVVLVGTGSDGWLAPEEVRHNVCVRFVVRRADSGPREVTPEVIDCPPEVPPTPSPE